MPCMSWGNWDFASKCCLIGLFYRKRLSQLNKRILIFNCKMLLRDFALFHTSSLQPDGTGLALTDDK